MGEYFEIKKLLRKSEILHMVLFNGEDATFREMKHCDKHLFGATAVSWSWESRFYMEAHVLHDKTFWKEN